MGNERIITYGQGDPYWYEWSVGLKYIIEMLNPDSDIQYVELQANVAPGINDVVVTYKNTEKLFIQIKNTRTNDEITFSDLVNSEGTKGSLLCSLAKSWYVEKDNCANAKVLLYTNKRCGIKEAMRRGKREFDRPALKDFIQMLEEQIQSARSIDEINIPDHAEAWEEWMTQLNDIETDNDKLCFLKNLKISTNNPDLTNLEKELIEQIKQAFQTNDDIAEGIFANFSNALRIWSTSRGSKVDSEEVYSRLSLVTEKISYNQNLVPNDPFFASREDFVNQIEDEIKTGTHKVIFIYGVAGTGKTNTISKLCVNRDSIIDIRYYAYEPINPQKEYFPLDVSNRVDRNYFWNELFNQLRKKVKGHLAQYNVPICNDLMTLEEKRTRFFEIASKYAKDLGRSFVITIDGIDHAARATNIENTFLSTLPSPEYIPDNVKIILAGQPKENYKNYPNWLFTNNADVYERQIPAITYSDIELLINSKFTDKEEKYRNQLAGIVSHYSDKNTLAAIFAIHEAELETDLIKLEENLKMRRLGSNLSEYYKTIWDNAISIIGKAFIDYKIAGIFAFLNEPIDEKKLIQIFQEEGISIADWRNILKTLCPLLNKYNGQYSVLHNDVRLFMASIIKIDAEHVQEIYNVIVDYYMNLDKKNEAYYFDIVKFINASRRLDEFDRIFHPQFIIEAYTCGRSIEELEEDAFTIFEYLLSLEKLDWEKMRLLAFDFMTINQIKETKYEIGGNSFRKEKKYRDLIPYECYVAPTTEWNVDLIEEVLISITDLWKQEEQERARILFRNWFSGMNISDVITIISSSHDDVIQSQKCENIAEKFGISIVLFGQIKELSVTEEFLGRYAGFAKRVYESSLDAIIENYSGSELMKMIGEIQYLYPESLLKNIMKLIKESRLSDISNLYTTLRVRSNINSEGMLIATFLGIISSSLLIQTGECDTLWEQIKALDLSMTLSEYELIYYCMYAFVGAFLRNVHFADVARETVEIFNKNHKKERNGFVEVCLHNASMIGKWFSNSGNAATFFLPDDLRHMMNGLFIKKWDINSSYMDYFGIQSFFLKAYIYLTRNAEDEMRSVVNDICEHLFDDNPVKYLETGLYYYKDNAERKREWFNYWLGDAGKVWDLPIGDRNEIITRFLKSLSIYDPLKSVDTKNAIDRIQWSVIGFASRKEYTCDYLLNWYKEVTQKQGKVEHQIAKDVKYISDCVEKVGDNRLDYLLNSKVYEDLFTCGDENIISLLSDNYNLCQVIETPDYLVDGLIGYLKDGSFTQLELMKMWALGIALLDWRKEDDHGAICSLQKAIEKVAERTGIPNIRDMIKNYGFAYIDLIPDGAQFVIPERWPDEKVEYEIDEDDIKKSTIERYLNGERIVSDIIVRCLDVLSERGEIETETYVALMKKELEKKEWDIQYNQVLYKLVEKLSPETMDYQIKEYFQAAMIDNRNYLRIQLPTIVLWKTKQLEPSYTQNGIKSLLDMYHNWLTSANHFLEPQLNNSNNLERYINWEDVTDVYSLFYQFIKILIMSDNADAARTAISGLYLLERIDDTFISFIERDWDEFHYRAKEWLMMTYELVWDIQEERRDTIQKCIERHCADLDFNVALYANLLFENIKKNTPHSYIREGQPYFLEIPVCGDRRMVWTPKGSGAITGDQFVIEVLEEINKTTGDDCTEIEKIAMNYANSFQSEHKLISINRMQSGGYSVCLSSIPEAFFRVLYKEWVYGRWNGREAQLARAVLSASEPYCLLNSPYPWRKESVIFDNPERFFDMSFPEKEETARVLFETGIDSNECVIAGSFTTYSGDKELNGYCLSYIDSPSYNDRTAMCKFERNSRSFLMKRDDYEEEDHYNITLHYIGVESFIDSIFPCGISKKALDYFGWQLYLKPCGFILTDKEGNEIGHQEIYYAKRDLMSRDLDKQPNMKRLIISKSAINHVPIRSVIDIR